MFEYPTRIRIRSCSTDANTELEKPYTLASLNAPYITRDPCECQESPSYSSTTTAPFIESSEGAGSLITCANSCYNTAGCKSFSLTKITNDKKLKCLRYSGPCTCKPDSPKGTSNHEMTVEQRGHGWPDKWIITNPSRTD